MGNVHKNNIKKNKFKSKISSIVMLKIKIWHRDNCTTKGKTDKDKFKELDDMLCPLLVYGYW